MKRIRVIPVLLIQKGGLVKSVRFKNHLYIGDPINAVKIFNDKEVDEIVILDISATKEKRPPNMQQIKQLAAEAFMPLAYGGGITALNEIKELVNGGVEKVIINRAAAINPGLVEEAATWAGSQSVVVSMDVKKNIFGKYQLYNTVSRQKTDLSPVTFARRMESAGAGELLLQDVDRDGSFSGYSAELISLVSRAVTIPVVAVGGAASVADFAVAVKAGASAVGAGSMFVLQRPHRAVLISYPSQELLQKHFFSQLV
jgi:cyclase